MGEGCAVVSVGVCVCGGAVGFDGVVVGSGVGVIIGFAGDASVTPKYVVAWEGQ